MIVIRLVVALVMIELILPAEQMQTCLQLSLQAIFLKVMSAAFEIKMTFF